MLCPSSLPVARSNVGCLRPVFLQGRKRPRPVEATATPSGNRSSAPTSITTAPVTPTTSVKTPITASPARQLPGVSTVSAEGSGGQHGPDASHAKHELKFAVAGTFRGGTASSAQRGAIEEAQVALEAFCDEVDFQKLEGLWRLIYTTALDVVPLVRAPSTPFPLPVQIGNIYQQFSSPEVGEVRNIIKLSVPLLLEPGDDGATFRVEARYSVESPRRIALRFQAGGISDVNISSFTETLIAPALVGRNFISHQILLALHELNIRIPLPTASNLRQGTAVGQFLLSYLDDDMLIGRAENGTFIFERGS